MIHTGDLIRIIKKQNGNLWINASPKKWRENYPAIIYNGQDEIVGCPKGAAPENNCVVNGRLITRGWRSIVDHLAGEKLINKQKALEDIRELH